MNPKIPIFGLTLMCVGLARATFLPAPLTPSSYNADIVVEKNATPSLRVSTTASIDTGTNNTAATLFEVGFDTANPANGLPVAGSTIVAADNANYSFKMPPSYAAPNGILIDTVVTSGTFTLTTPAAYNKLSFLGLGGNGGDVISVRVNHQDGTFENGSFGCPDWFGGNGVAVIMNGRITTTYNLNAETDGTSGDGRGNPRVYFRDITLTNTTSPVTSLVLTYASGSASSHNDIIAVSGASTPGGAVSPINVTGYTYDFVVEANAIHRARVVSQTIQDGTNVWATTQSMDNTGNTANSWYERGYNYNILGSGPVHPTSPDVLAIAAGSGLPAPGSMVTNALGDRIYQLPASYTANNAVYLSPTNTNTTVTLVTPVTATVLSFLGAAGNGDQNPTVVISHQDGTKETNSIRVPDWFNQTPAYVFGANGRVAVDTAQINNATNTAFTPRMFGCDVIVSAASPITSIDLTYTNTAGGRIALFALSATSDPILPVFVANPANVHSYVDGAISFTASAIANVGITYQWQKGTNGVFVNVANGGSISGAQTTTLNISPVAENDDATYRLVATTGAGSVNSASASLIVISPLQVITTPSDPIVAYQPDGGSSPDGENVTHAIDQNTTKYLNFGNGTSVNNNGIRLGFRVTPTAGRSRVNAMVLYTANDSSDRDPANVILEGSDDGGTTWSLIYSNLVSMPDDRNSSPASLDPIAQNITQVRFANNETYGSYRWYTSRLKGSGTDRMQIGEVELRGVIDNTLPNVALPVTTAGYDQGSASINATITGATGQFWLKKNGSSYTLITDGGAISGANTPSLSFFPLSFADAGDYVCVATNFSGAITSNVGSLLVVSTNLDVTSFSDPISGFGDTTGSRYGENTNASYAIDDFNTIAYQNGGSGDNAGAGFGPFGGPVGLIVTPAAGSTRLAGFRVYPAVDSPANDPADYILEGSNDGGAHYTVISQGALDLPLARANNSFQFDPIVQPMQEILFANSGVYTSYRITFNHVRDNSANGASYLQVGEIELLGVVAAPTPVVSIAAGGGSLSISTTISGTLMSTTNLVSPIIWATEGPIDAGTPYVIVPPANVPAKFFRVTVP